MRLKKYNLELNYKPKMRNSPKFYRKCREELNVYDDDMCCRLL